MEGSADAATDLPAASDADEAAHATDQEEEKPGRDVPPSAKPELQGDARQRWAPVPLVTLPPVQRHPEVDSGGGKTTLPSSLDIAQDVPLSLVLGTLACVGLLSAALGVACWACQSGGASSGGSKRGRRSQGTTARYKALRRERECTASEGVGERRRQNRG